MVFQVVLHFLFLHIRGAGTLFYHSSITAGVTCLLQEMQEKSDAEIGAPDPCDVDNKKVADNLNLSMQNQSTTKYGSIPNGTAATDGKNIENNSWLAL